MVDPVDYLKSMYQDIKHSRELLLQITNKEHFENVFTPGEQKSIEELGKSAKFKSEALYSAVTLLKELD